MTLPEGRKLTAVDAIDQLDKLIGAIHKRVNRLVDESHAAALQWDRLLKTGAGRRNDHAAAILKRIRPYLVELRTYADTCIQQLDAMD